MNFIQRLFAKKPKTRDITATNFDGVFNQTVLSGVAVNENSALALSTLWRAARVVSEAIGTDAPEGL